MAYVFPRQEFLQDLQGLMDIKSVGRDMSTATETAPMGQGPLEALVYMLALGQREGFSTKMLDGLCGWMEIGQGEEMLAILVHVDTVGVSDNWTFPPFALTVKDDMAYGRGVCDNKGPAMAAFYAMKALKDSGQPLSRRIRLIVGTDEEHGDWACMRRYRQTEELPTMAFAPDSTFPVTYAEKGILHFCLRRPVTEDLPPLHLLCESAYNVVPTYAQAQWQNVHYEEQGKNAHAMEPHKGVNALQKLCRRLQADACPHPLVKLALRCTPEGLGIAFTDQPSGSLTINPASAFIREGQMELRCDCRIPVTFTKEQVEQAVQTAVADLGFTLVTEEWKAPLYVPLDSPLVSTLANVYRDMTGDMTPPQSSGGGTYARAFPNAVAFGAMFPTDPETFHQNDECWPIASMEKATAIMAEVLRRLAT